MEGRRLRSLIGWLLVTGVAAAVAGLGSRDAAEFYATLARPAWAPPASVFGPTWTALYALMALSAWLVSRAPDADRRRRALGLYLAQLAVNAAWSWVFFRLQRGGWALAVILVLLALLVPTVVAFWRLRPLAGALLLPYLGWAAYATALMAAIERANPARL